ncbi:MAG: hypothetical protein M1816_002027 [Peltula sp. TS41687]|nr:MAG: hypothetical protein M1816_002027 [Peltula sp. TS41687]
MEMIILAGHWSLHQGPDQFSLDPSVREYVRDHLLSSAHPSHRDRMQPYRAEGPSFVRACSIYAPVPADDLGDGAAWQCESDAALFRVPEPEEFRGSFWTSSVYGNMRWNRSEYSRVEDGWPSLIDALQGLLCLGGPTPCVGPVAFARAIRAFGMSPGGARSRVMPHVLRLPPTGLLPWLIVSDLAHFWPNHVASPSVGDLAHKIFIAAACGEGGQGPWLAFRRIEHQWRGGRAC